MMFVALEAVAVLLLVVGRRCRRSAVDFVWVKARKSPFRTKGGIWHKLAAQ